MDGLAVHHDQGKPRYDLIPPEVMDALADHYRRGAKKYEDRNWERGMAWCRMFGSLMRHSWAWMRGQDFDEETGTHHMVCVIWNAAALFTYYARKSGLDDRPITAFTGMPGYPAYPQERVGIKAPGSVPRSPPT